MASSSTLSSARVDIDSSTRLRYKGFFERAVVVALSAAEAEQLPEPSENPGILEYGGAEDSERPLAGKLRRAWDRISGRY